MELNDSCQCELNTTLPGVETLKRSSAFRGWHGYLKIVWNIGGRPE
jgi:hypothetical protein